MRGDNSLIPKPDTAAIHNLIENIFSPEGMKHAAVAAVLQECGVGLNEALSRDYFTSDAWKKIIEASKHNALILHAAKKDESIPEVELKRYLAMVLLPLIANSDFAMAYRLANSTKIASPELCAFIGQCAIDALFESRGATLTKEELERDLTGMPAVDLQKAIDRLRALKESQPAQSTSQEGDEEFEGTFEDLPRISISPDVSMKEMWDQLETTLSNSQYELFVHELADRAKHISTFLLVDSRNMTMSVREFCKSSSSLHPEGYEISLSELRTLLPVKLVRTKK